ncbi:hypothetical protein QTV43_000448 [Vibrio vulnificus]|nr:hypothetical protein [Vibrio vulnificus]
MNNAIEVDSWEQGNIVSNRFVHNDNVDATPDEVTEAIAGHFDITISDNDFPFLFLTSPQYDNVKSELMKRSTP